LARAIGDSLLHLLFYMPRPNNNSRQSARRCGRQSDSWLSGMVFVEAAEGALTVEGGVFNLNSNVLYINHAPTNSGVEERSTSLGTRSLLEVFSLEEEAPLPQARQRRRISRAAHFASGQAESRSTRLEF